MFRGFPKVPTGGALKPINFCKKHGKPCLHISRASHDPEVMLRKFVEEHGIQTLNVAGSRESKDPGIYQWVKQVLAGAFFSGEEHPGVFDGPGEG